MDISEKVKELIGKVKNVKSQNRLPGNCFFLDNDEIACFPRAFGDSRFPYSRDGLTLWAYSSGNVNIEESAFNVMLGSPEGKEPNLCFHLGIKKGKKFFPVSITGAGRLPFEEVITRFTVFSSDAAYYFAETREFLSCVRMFVDGNKNVRFTVYIENLTDARVESYVSSYYNLMLFHLDHEYPETKWYKSCCVTKSGFEFGTTEYMDRSKCLLHRAEIVRDYQGKVYSTTSHGDFCGSTTGQLCCSTALQNGFFDKCKAYTIFTETAIAGDIIPVTLKCGGSFTVSYTLSVGDNRAEMIKTDETDILLYSKKNASDDFLNIPSVEFSGIWKGINPDTLNYFINNVFKQNEFCARAKNYAGPLIGVRDIFQQIESAEIWIPDHCRKKIIEALNFIGENGRAPRQYSYPKEKDVIPTMDLRPYIDQGVWIISTVYNYLAQTNDFSILDEKCGYYKFSDNKVDFSSDKDSVFDHLIRITEYLISNLDEETGCLKALYGDWNDALDGLGKTEDKNREFGNGVSVMATLQLYKNLKEISEISAKRGKSDIAERYFGIRDSIGCALKKFAIVENDIGERKILHGWGENRSYLVASFCDNDGFSRDGLTSNAFFIISGAIDTDESLKKDILAAYERLDGKYGLKTFEPYFPIENTKVGRITHLPKGTAENGATYIHATLFGIWSLFMIGEAEKAWEQIYKILPITHEFISTTPFVMPNSYIENAEKGLDGESMSDWFTGSGCVLIKVLIWCVFGIRPTLDGLYISPANYIPFDKAKITVNVKSCAVTVVYGKSDGKRRFFINGKEAECFYDEKLKTQSIYFDNEEIQGKPNIIIKVC